MSARQIIHRAWVHALNGYYGARDAKLSRWDSLVCAFWSGWTVIEGRKRNG